MQIPKQEVAEKTLFISAVHNPGAAPSIMLKLLNAIGMAEQLKKDQFGLDGKKLSVVEKIKQIFNATAVDVQDHKQALKSETTEGEFVPNRAAITTLVTALAERIAGLAVEQVDTSPTMVVGLLDFNLGASGYDIETITSLKQAIAAQFVENMSELHFFLVLVGNGSSGLCRQETVKAQQAIEILAAETSLSFHTYNIDDISTLKADMEQVRQAAGERLESGSTEQNSLSSSGSFDSLVSRSTDASDVPMSPSASVTSLVEVAASSPLVATRSAFFPSKSADKRNTKTSPTEGSDLVI
jgi:hypothetical protein